MLMTAFLLVTGQAQSARPDPPPSVVEVSGSIPKCAPDAPVLRARSPDIRREDDIASALAAIQAKYPQTKCVKEKGQ